MTHRATVPVEDLHEAALLAEVLFRVNAAREHGLIEGEPDVDLERCEDVLAQARERGIEISDDELDTALVEFVTEAARPPNP